MHSQRGQLEWAVTRIEAATPVAIELEPLGRIDLRHSIQMGYASKDEQLGGEAWIGINARSAFLQQVNGLPM